MAGGGLERLQHDQVRHQCTAGVHSTIASKQFEQSLERLVRLQYDLKTA
jgi:hypothetical protein